LGKGKFVSKQGKNPAFHPWECLPCFLAAILEQNKTTPTPFHGRDGRDFFLILGSPDEIGKSWGQKIRTPAADDLFRVSLM